MSISKIYTVNTTGTTIATEEGTFVQVPFGSVIRRRGKGIMLDGGSLVGYGTGYFDFSGAIAFVPEAVGPVSVQVLQDGVVIPGSAMTAYAADASQPIVIPIVGMARNIGGGCGNSTTVFTMQIDSPGTIQTMSVVATKVD